MSWISHPLQKRTGIGGHSHLEKAESGNAKRNVAKEDKYAPSQILFLNYKNLLENTKSNEARASAINISDRSAFSISRGGKNEPQPKQF